jgi:hypothetical protein
MYGNILHEKRLDSSSHPGGTMLSLEGHWNDLPHASRRGWHAVVALLTIAITLGGCSDNTAAPPSPGSIVVTTETTGFLKAQGYNLMVDGVSNGAIGANDSVTITDLDPGEYELDLGDVPDNCSADGNTVSVESKQTAQASIVVTCTYATPVTYTIQFNRERPDLDIGEVTVCPFGICSTQEGWDLYVYNNFSTDPHSVIRQNQTTAVEIAHLPGVTLGSLTEADLQGANFTTDLISDPFDTARVILIRTDLGNVYALGNPSEDLTNGTLTFDAALIAKP